MNLPKIHPREKIVTTAEGELSQFLLESGVEYAESFMAYAVVLHSVGMTTQASLQGKSAQMLEFLLDWQEKFELTTGEMVSIIARSISNDAKYIIRWERHGRLDEPGGLA